ncbi:MAG: hypothetical protein JO072_13955 [Parafilimonas sp.]|nr:hypothetical protein [Parafilimonas sp.]
MARTSEGILGAFVGTIGPVTGYVRNGQNILRSSASNVKYKPTALRSAQLEKLKVCNRFTKTFSGTGFFNKSFPAYGNTGNGYNRATSVLMNQALIGDYPHIHLSYQHVMISKGKLPSALHAAAVPMKNKSIYFNFSDNSSTGTASASDVVILVAHSEALQQTIFSLNAGFRKNCEAILEASIFKNQLVETWMGFLSSDGTHASNSVYTGRIQL